MLTKIVAVQARMGRRLTLEEKMHIFKQRPDFVCLPEYWLIDETVEDFHRAALHASEYRDYLCRLSDELTACLVGGTIVEAEGDCLYNTGYVIDRGTILGKYRKRFPVPGEQAKGIQSGTENLVLNIDGINIAMLICGDVFHPQVWSELRALSADLVMVPTTSPFRPDDSLSQKKHRDQLYFVSGAEQAGAYIIKSCAVGTIFGHLLQGRSLVAAPWGILSRVDFGDEGSRRMLTLTLDIAELREFRRKYRRVEQTETAQTGSTDA
ncbi:MAG: carbon-nitrogen hydrolase family protein [Candidatus Zixiibacteriota bacterium]